MKYYFFILFIFCAVISHAQIDVSSDVVIPNHYVVSKTSEAPIINGLADEPAWINAKFTGLFIDIEGKKIPKYKTKVKMLWDENYLYVFAYLQEPHIWGNLKQRDTIIFYNNDFEVFIDPSGDTRNYGEIEINALGTIWDLLLDKTYRIKGKANNNWNLIDLKSAIHIEGSLNNPNDTDQYWSVELAIPLDALIELRNKPRSIPKEGEQWRINFSRVHWDHDIVNGKYDRKKENGKYTREYNWVWSNQKVINMHEPEKWGFLQFTHNENSNSIEFIKDEDLLIKQTAYALFRNTRFGRLKHLLNSNTSSKKVFEVQYTENKKLKAYLFKTNFGFEYKVTSPVTKKDYVINEEGILKLL